MKSLFLTSAVAAILLSGCAVSPQRLTDADVDAFVEGNLAQVTANQEEVSGPIGLYEAMARALKYNLDFKVEMMNEALAASTVDVKSAAMLPQFVVASGYDGRDNDAGGYSRTLPGGVKSAGASTSTERDVFAANAQLSWNILDFGLSYVRAKQAADEVLIAEERRRKVVNRIIEDVRTAYWRAVSSQRLVGGLEKLEKRVAGALAGSKELAKEGSVAPLTALAYERELVDIRKQIHELLRDLKTARVQLAALMNLAPGTDYSILVTNRSPAELKLGKSVQELAQLALHNRPELREAQLKHRINDKEVDAALLELLPGINVFAGADISTNDLLYNADWISYGAKASWNLMKVFSLPAKKAQIAAQEDLLRQQSLAYTMAVVTQVYVSRVRYQQNYEILKDAGDAYAVQKRIANQVRTSAAEDAASEQTLIREEMNTLVSAAKYDIAYADLQNAFANVYASVGIDPYGEGITGEESVKQLARHLRGVWIERGDKSGS